MAEQAEVEQVDAVAQEAEDEVASNYKPPAEKSIKEILEADAEDESLRKYKESLGISASNVVVDPSHPGNVIIRKIGLDVEGREEVVLDLSVCKEEIKKKPFIIKEDCEYTMKIYFHTQREIVSGLKYVQKTTRKGVKVDSSETMLGSFAPKVEEYCVKAPKDRAPKGLVARGSYKVKSSFIDDDKNTHASWEWNIEIKKDWQ